MSDLTMQDRIDIVEALFASADRLQDDLDDGNILEEERGGVRRRVHRYRLLAGRLSEGDMPDPMAVLMARAEGAPGDVPLVHAMTVDGVRLSLVNWFDSRGWEVRPFGNAGQTLGYITTLQDEGVTTFIATLAGMPRSIAVDHKFSRGMSALRFLIGEAGLTQPGR